LLILAWSIKNHSDVPIFLGKEEFPPISELTELIAISDSPQNILAFTTPF